MSVADQRYPRTIAAAADAPLTRFSSPVQTWFTGAFERPTPAQEQGWAPITRGEHTLILAPTGSGKTLAAFLWAIDRLLAAPVPDAAHRCRILYVSPLKALAVDVERNLRAPLVGIRREAARAGVPVHEPTVGIRSGDTPSRERRLLVRAPPDILITTPESLYLMLTSQARETLRDVHTVIVDEIHSLAATKRGAHLALSLERLEALTAESPQRIGLSATQRPLDEIARFLGGAREVDGRLEPRPVAIVDAGTSKELDVEVIVPVEDLAELASNPAPSSGAYGADGLEAGDGRPEPVASIWPHVYPRLLDEIVAHRSTLVFVNSRRLAERVAARLNELAVERGESTAGGPDLVRAHHGSLAREQRLSIEDDLKAGRLRGLVATSSLELGIDMGTVDLVVQVESPGSVARGLQRIGRAGHHVGEPSRGKIFPKYRADLLEAAVIVPRMHAGMVEETRYPRNPLDVLAQQIVAACSVDEWQVDELLALVRRAANFADLTDDVWISVLDLLAGRYPSDEFATLRARVVWDRVAGTVRAREGAGRVAIANAGTIPDRGLFGVFLPDGTRVGELDEEMVYESRAGETFVLGASTWRIEQITHDRVVVSPAPGEPGRMPFWHGDKPGRPLELGRALGATVRELRDAEPAAARERLHRDAGLDDLAAGNLLQYLDDQVAATGVLPDDRTLVVERFPDEIGDWRVCLLSPFGSRVHAPWALALEERLSELLDQPVSALWSDDGIVLRLPEAVDALPLDGLVIDPDEVEELVVRRLPGTALFASRFREAAARALLLPRRRPGERAPLWQQRRRAADLLTVAARHPQFPILLETTRECLRDVFDLPALRDVLAQVRSRTVRMVSVDTLRASPFAQSLLFGWIAAYMYEGDTPLAERRAGALALDRDLLRELLGADELRELLDADALVQVELELQRLDRLARLARGPDDVHDLLRLLGDLSVAELEARVEGDPVPVVDALVAERRAIRVRVAGVNRIAAAEDAGRLRDALGVAIPPGLPGVFTETVPDALADLLARYARTHAPFTTGEVAERLGLPHDVARMGLASLATAGRVVEGAFRPDGSTSEWCDHEVLRRLRRRSLAILRQEVEPVEPEALARFLVAWQGIAPRRRGDDALVEAIAQLQGAVLSASVLERDILGARVERYRPDLLDALVTGGEVVWVGAGAVGASDGKLMLCFRDQAHLLLSRAPTVEPPTGALADQIRTRLATGAAFWTDLVRAVGSSTDERVLVAALWDLVWAGEVTNDGLASLRAYLAGGKVARARRSGRAAPRPGRLSRLGPPAGGGRWSLVTELLPSEPPATERTLACAGQLLERHGIVTREGVRAEGAPGGFAALYPALSALEATGRIRRGYFVAGLGAAQFAAPGAVDRLRAHRDRTDEIQVLAATDPAQPYGAVLPWPEATGGRPSRTSGASVISAGGVPIAYLDAGSGRLMQFPGADPAAIAEGLRAFAKERSARLEIRTIDGGGARSSGLTTTLREIGFTDSYRGIVLWP